MKNTLVCHERTQRSQKVGLVAQRALPAIPVGRLALRAPRPSGAIGILLCGLLCSFAAKSSAQDFLPFQDRLEFDANFALRGSSSNFWASNYPGFSAWFGGHNFSGAGLTNIPAGQLTGSLPALSGASLTGVTDAGALHFNNNLSDISNAGTARANLGAAAVAGSSSQDFDSRTNAAVYFIGNGGGLTNLTVSPDTTVSYAQSTLALGGTGSTNVTLNAAYGGVSGVVQYLTNSYYLSLTTNAWFGQPSNLAVGQQFTVELAQDGTGNRTVNFNPTYWKFPAGVIGNATTNANATDVLSCVVNHAGTAVFIVQTFNLK